MLKNTNKYKKIFLIKTTGPIDYIAYYLTISKILFFSKDVPESFGCLQQPGICLEPPLCTGITLPLTEP